MAVTTRELDSDGTIYSFVLEHDSWHFRLSVLFRLSIYVLLVSARYLVSVQHQPKETQ